MKKNVLDVAVFGAGTAGLSAIDEIQKKTKKFVLVNRGVYGTTCARVGCMPSKVLIQVANDFHRRKVFKHEGILGAEGLSVDSSRVLAHVRQLRDRFVKGIVEDTLELGAKNIIGSPRFLSPTEFTVNGDVYKTKRTVIATGTSPVIPESWNHFKKDIITSDTLFELQELPKSVVAVGLGAIGLEIGQALHRLGVQVAAFGRSKNISTLTDPVVNSFAEDLFKKEFPIFLGEEPKIVKEGNVFKVTAHGQNYGVENILASLGRRPNLRELDLEKIGVSLDATGVPKFNRKTLQIGRLPLFLAGDVNRHLNVLHEAADDGMVAGINSVRTSPKEFMRRVPLSITFSDPNIVSVGRSYKSLEKENFKIGTVHIDFGRAIILNEEGMIRVYGKAKSGLILGAEMITPGGEHLAHFLASMIANKMTCFDALKLPFYHPVLEEGLQEALIDLAENI
jgi:dihydrolipoamide dehydrogenase